MSEKIFRYKLDFYYQQAVIYLATLVLYVGIRGNFIEDQFSVVFKDPILYIIIFFVVLSIVVLLLNIWRDRRLIITDDAIIFQSRGKQRILPVNEIEWIHIGKERFVETAGHFQSVNIQCKDKPITLRIRVGRYEKSRELVAEIERIAGQIPQKNPPHLRRSRKIRIQQG
ncbi:MAG: hypothetical protein KBG83_05990 [Bacteroidetes bacterium]|nr:hypothetical protein [Bacteroidota bacterium]